MNYSHPCNCDEHKKGTKCKNKADILIVRPRKTNKLLFICYNCRLPDDEKVEVK